MYGIIVGVGRDSGSFRDVFVQSVHIEGGIEGGKVSDLSFTFHEDRAAYFGMERAGEVRNALQLAGWPIPEDFRKYEIAGESAVVVVRP